MSVNKKENESIDEELLKTLETVEDKYKEILRKYTQFLAHLFRFKKPDTSGILLPFTKFFAIEVGRYEYTGKFVSIRNLLTIFLLERENILRKQADSRRINYNTLLSNEKVPYEKLQLSAKTIERLKNDIKDQEIFEEKFLGAGIFKKVYRGLGAISGALAAVFGVFQFGDIEGVDGLGIWGWILIPIIVIGIVYLLGMGKIEYRIMKRYADTSKIEDDFFEILSNYGEITSNVSKN